jgi:hypothetical protein
MEKIYLECVCGGLLSIEVSEDVVRDVVRMWREVHGGCVGVQMKEDYCGSINDSTQPRFCRSESGMYYSNEKVPREVER